MAILRYAPPPQTTPEVVNVPSTYYGGQFAPDQDVTLILPPVPRTSSMTIAGGRNVRIVGGAIANATSAGAAALHASGVAESFFIEGVDIDQSKVNADALNVCGGPDSYPDVYIQNCRFHGVNGSDATVHADLYQPQGPISRLFVDRFSGRSNYQGFFISPQFPITEAAFSHVDLAYEAGGVQPITYLLWLLDAAAQTPFPVSLDEVYLAPRAGQTIAAGGIWPASTVATIGAITTDGGQRATWPTPMRVAGEVISGAPSAGDFVPSGMAGVSYISPGYA